MWLTFCHPFHGIDFKGLITLKFPHSTTNARMGKPTNTITDKFLFSKGSTSFINGILKGEINDTAHNIDDWKVIGLYRMRLQ